LTRAARDEAHLFKPKLRCKHFASGASPYIQHLYG
jgi:hypothetical protein